MRISFATGAAALALALAACSGGSNGNDSAAVSNAPLKQIPAPNGGDWTLTVSQTPEGGMRMGNPEAPVKLIEYASVTCPHCREFEEQGAPTLRDKYVKSGQVSWEFRPYMLFPSDPGPSMLLLCQGPTPFFRLTEELYADQPNWAGRLQSLPEAQLQQLSEMPPAQRAAAFVNAAGLQDFFRQRGMPEAKIEECLTSEANLTKLASITQRGTTDGVTGTPTFFINGKIVENTASWPALEPKLRGAIE
jgi:protein-disulfide isomerase